MDHIKSLQIPRAGDNMKQWKLSLDAAGWSVGTTSLELSGVPKCFFPSLEPRETPYCAPGNIYKTRMFLIGSCLRAAGYS